MLSWLLAQTPNLITLIRIALVVPIALLLLAADYQTALLLVLVAGVSDGLDGWLARVGGWRTRFGAGLDAFADKIFLAVSFLCLWWQSLLPLWLAVVVIARDLYLVVGGLIYNHWFERLEMLSPSRISKWNTTLQIGLVVLILVAAAWPHWVPEKLIFVCNRVVLLTTLITFFDYAWTWTQRARQVGLKSSQSANNYLG